MSVGCGAIRDIFAQAEVFLHASADASIKKPKRRYDGLSEKELLDADIPGELFACCEYYRALKRAATHADANGDFAEANEAVRRMNAVSHFFNKKLFDTDTVRDIERPDMLAVPLSCGLVPSVRERSVAGRLAACAGNPYDISYICTVADMLCRHGYGETAYRLILCADDISGDRAAELAGWLFEALSGISPEKLSAAHTVLSPIFIKETAPFRAVYGDKTRIGVKWHFEGDNAVYAFDTSSAVTLVLPDGTVSSFPAGRHTAVCRCAT